MPIVMAALQNYNGMESYLHGNDDAFFLFRRVVPCFSFEGKYLIKFKQFSFPLYRR